MATEEVDYDLHQYWQNFQNVDLQNAYLNLPNGWSPIARAGSLSPNQDILFNIHPGNDANLPNDDGSTRLTEEEVARIFERHFQSSPSMPSPVLVHWPQSGPSWATESTLQSEPTITGPYQSPRVYVNPAALDLHVVPSPIPSNNPGPNANPRKRKPQEMDEASSTGRSSKRVMLGTPSPLINLKKRKIGDVEIHEDVSNPGTPSKRAATGFQLPGNVLQIELVTQELARQGKYGTSNPKSEREKQEIARVRQAGGSCFKCRMLNKKCHASHTGICPPCKKSPQLCFRLDLDDCVFFRTTTPLHSNPVREQDKTWASHDVLTLNLHCVPLGVAACCEPLVIACKRFIPQTGDNLKKSPGGKNPQNFIEVEPYVAYSSPAVYQTLLSRMSSYRKAFLLEMVREGTSPVTIEVMNLADHLSKSRKGGLVHAALDIWVCAHLNAVERSLCGTELLGMRTDIIDDPTSFLFGHVPIPPQLDNQLDNLILDGMKEKAAWLLKNIWTKFKTKNKGDWLELWVTTYILLNTVEFVLGVQQHYVSYLGNTIHRDKILAHWRHNREQWTWSGDHIVDAFNYYHKRVKLPLGPVLDQGILSDITSSSELDKDALRMLRSTKEKIQAALHSEQSSSTNTPVVSGKVNYETMWTSKILFMK